MLWSDYYCISTSEITRKCRWITFSADTKHLTTRTFCFVPSSIMQWIEIILRSTVQVIVSRWVMLQGLIYSLSHISQNIMQNGQIATQVDRWNGRFLTYAGITVIYNRQILEPAKLLPKFGTLNEIPCATFLNWHEKLFSFNLSFLNRVSARYYVLILLCSLKQ